MIETKKLDIGMLSLQSLKANDELTVYISDGKYHEEITAEKAVEIICFLVKVFEIK